jgi:hypothetical protein
MRRPAATILLAWAGALLAVSTPVLAQSPAAGDPALGPAPGTTSLPVGLTLRAPSVIKAGQEIDVDATLAIGGFLRPDADLHFLIDGIERRIERTDAGGTAHFRLREVLASGIHQLLVKDGGTTRYLWSGPASIAATLEVAPLVITVHTVPALPGITLALDGNTGFVSDAAGLAVLPVATAGVHTLAVRLPAPDQSSRISFIRWSDDSWTPSRPIRVMQDTSIFVGLRVAYLTPIRFVGLDRNLLDPTRVFDVVISGPNAEVIQLQYPYDPIWLQTPLPAKNSGESGLHITPAPYSLSVAKYDWLNVASTGQMRYSPTSGGTWSIPLLLFTLRLGARDAIFGTTLHDPIRLTGPSGHAQIVTLDRQGRITLILGRGNYAAQVLAPGVTPIATIALSRSQEVIAPVITPVDLFVVGLACLVIMGGVFVAGRGRLWAFGRLSAVRVRYADPVIQGFNLRWERRSPQSAAVQGVVAAIVDPLALRVQPDAPLKLDIPENIEESDRPRDPDSLRILDGGAKVDSRRGAGFADAGEALAARQTSVASRAVSTFPRSYLLSGDAGLGQTIEVGEIIRGLLNSGKAERFLLLVHQSVMRQWQQELKEEFAIGIPRFERSSFYDPDDRELEWSGNPWKAFPLLLASSHLARRRQRRDELLAAGPWDVVVVDEAHEAHRSGSKTTSTPNKLLAVLQAMKLSRSWKALYLTSATPRQMHLNDAWDLMELLGLTHLRADAARDFARYHTIPRVERPDRDWEFLRQMCDDYFSDTGAARPEELKQAASRMPGVPARQGHLRRP